VKFWAGRDETIDTMFPFQSSADPGKKGTETGKSNAGQGEMRGVSRGDLNGRDATFKQWMLAEAVAVGRALNGKGSISAKHAMPSGKDKDDANGSTDPFFCCE
jgi:hypothetical protein